MKTKLRATMSFNIMRITNLLARCIDINWRVILLSLMGLMLIPFMLSCGSDTESDTPESPANVEQTSPIQAPDFTLPSASTPETVSLSQFKDEQPVVLVFYRAYW